MRLDKFLSITKTLSRKETALAIKRQQIFVNNKLATNKEQLVDINNDKIMYNNNLIKYTEFIYLMLNKPKGYVSSTDDPRDKTVLELLPNEYTKFNLFPCGRLDKDTTGLVILTNNGKSAHALLLPRNHVSKTYFFEISDPITLENIEKIENGIELRDGYITKPCKIKMLTSTTGNITIVEGKYHEIKRMFGAVHNKIIELKRLSFSSIILDPKLKEGEFRPLNSEEVKVFENILKS